jgi:hypothetical protein
VSICALVVLFEEQVSTTYGSSGKAAAAAATSSDGDTGDDELKELLAAAVKAERLQTGAGGNSAVRKIVKGIKITDDHYERLEVSASLCCNTVRVLSYSVL